MTPIKLHPLQPLSTTTKYVPKKSESYSPFLLPWRVAGETSSFTLVVFSRVIVELIWTMSLPWAIRQQLMELNIFDELIDLNIGC